MEGACSQKLRTLILQSTHFTLSEVAVFKDYKNLRSALYWLTLCHLDSGHSHLGSRNLNWPNVPSRSARWYHLSVGIRLFVGSATPGLVVLRCVIEQVASATKQHVPKASASVSASKFLSRLSTWLPLVKGNVEKLSDQINLVLPEFLLVTVFSQSNRKQTKQTLSMANIHLHIQGMGLLFSLALFSFYSFLSFLKFLSFFFS